MLMSMILEKVNLFKVGLKSILFTLKVVYFLIIKNPLIFKIVI